MAEAVMMARRLLVLMLLAVVEGKAAL